MLLRLLRVLVQRAPNLPPGRVAVGVQHPVARVRSLARKRQLPVRVTVKVHAPLQQLQHAPRTLVHQHARRLFVHQSRTGRNRVAQVQLRRIIRPQRHRNAALCILRIRFGKFALGQA